MSSTPYISYSLSLEVARFQTAPIFKKALFYFLLIGVWISLIGCAVEGKEELWLTEVTTSLPATIKLLLICDYLGCCDFLTGYGVYTCSVWSIFYFSKVNIQENIENLWSCGFPLMFQSSITLHIFINYNHQNLLS